MQLMLHRKHYMREQTRIVLICGHQKDDLVFVSTRQEPTDKCQETVTQQVYSSSKCTSGIPSNPDGTA